jgi:hypothetical protein
MSELGFQLEGEEYGSRLDGAPKGRGYFGPIRLPDGNVMTELSIGVDYGSGEKEIPAITPLLSREELDSLIAGNPITEDVIRKAVTWARAREHYGLSPWAREGETYPLPARPEERDERH